MMKVFCLWARIELALWGVLSLAWPCNLQASLPQTTRLTSSHCFKILNQNLQALPAATTQAYQLLATRKAGIVYSAVPPVELLSISSAQPPPYWCSAPPLSVGLTDPILERARELRLFDDFKILSDLKVRSLLPGQLLSLSAHALQKAELHPDASACEKLFLKDYIETIYERPLELLPATGVLPPKFGMTSGDPLVDEAFAYTELTWSKLVKFTKPATGGSLLPSPYPVLIPAGRFQEAYYWDSYFGLKGLLATGRLDIAQMQVENFLSYIRMYGFVPNGLRDYYLSRSQPPFLSSMVREVYTQSLTRATVPSEVARLKHWLRVRAYPLLAFDYRQFWMDPSKRLNVGTGLNHHFDDINLPRPERHSADNELAIGKQYRDTRAAAESGLDFTATFSNEASRVAGPLLNAMLYKTEQDLAWFAGELGLATERLEFEQAGVRRKAALDRYLWNAKRGHFESFHLDKRQGVGILSAETFVPLFVKAASPAQAAAVRRSLRTLEKDGGLMASELTKSHHQWDGTNGWAPLQVMAIEGLRNYGYEEDAKRLALKWVKAVAKTYAEGGAMYERIDVERMAKPVVDESKYPTQEGFLWTNGSFVWAAVEVLHYPVRLLNNQPSAKLL